MIATMPPIVLLVTERTDTYWQRRNAAVGVKVQGWPLLSGHRCFGKYLHWIHKEQNSKCHQAGLTKTTADTMFECSSWSEERAKGKRVVGTFGIASVAEKMMSRAKWWDTVSTFAKQVMVKKEDHE
ncbi:uncharacterized protein LOC107884333 [Acyrthosiphon pisum]|uniref:Uncharacterized protein n=1 Tax=Acyrthosiphon pisum TaxID=7029 RepID=A0A8R2H7F4_ACYPI|nr:uncharacterized protein LOC107884333 [Acyrthosiphon pisum]|eukprot:XP_016661651.1 PREDICTED: uncharacterized protein LOC107884333 [Acyrthosiphon pisum]